MREPTRPKQASLRRAVSTAYYALFHLINDSAVAVVAPNVTLETNHRIRRWFDHAEMKKVCGRFLPVRLTAPLLQLIGPEASPDLQTVALTFIVLQDARHSADYDLSPTFSRSQALGLIQEAQTAFQVWHRIRRSSEANIFILSLLLWKNWERER